MLLISKVLVSHLQHMLNIVLSALSQSRYLRSALLVHVYGILIASLVVAFKLTDVIRSLVSLSIQLMAMILTANHVIPSKSIGIWMICVYSIWVYAYYLLVCALLSTFNEYTSYTCIYSNFGPKGFMTGSATINSFTPGGGHIVNDRHAPAHAGDTLPATGTTTSIRAHI